MSKTKSKTSTRAPAATRAAAVLKLLGNVSEPLGVNAVARELDVVPSSCLHVLRALHDEGLVHMHPITKKYTLGDRKSTRLNSSHVAISYAVFCLKKKNDRTRCRGPP